MLLVHEELRRSVPPGNHALSIGVFDGVHGGHRLLIQRMLEEGRKRGFTGGVITFHPHPVTVIRPEVPFLYLESLEQRVELLHQLDVAFVTVLQFTSELQVVSAADFTRMLVDEAGMRLLVVGEDFRLGRGAEGTVEVLTELGREQGFEVVAVPLLSSDDGAERISSTRIRAALAAGNMEEVAALLGRPFSLRGPVLRGDERGRQLGFPTMNVGVSADRALPPNGVYVTRARVGGSVCHGVTNVGMRPTFDSDHRQVETHLLDFVGDLYGQVVTIELLHHLREERKFEGIEALVEQIRCDVAETREWFAANER